MVEREVRVREGAWDVVTYDWLCCVVLCCAVGHGMIWNEMKDCSTGGRKNGVEVFERGLGWVGLGWIGFGGEDDTGGIGVRRVG